LDDLRKSWKPEHSGGESWVEESGIIPQVDETQNSIEEAKNTAAQEDALTLPEDLEVRTGDLIKYIDLSKPEEILQVVINGSPTDSASGTIADTTPLAQVLLGAVIGDNVTLRVPGAVAKTFQIQEIKRI
jgi:transcription elongation GreA/GreB family factor